MPRRGLVGLVALSALSACWGRTVTGTNIASNTGGTTVGANGGSTSSTGGAASTSGAATSTSAGSTGTNSGGTGTSGNSSGASSSGSSTGAVSCGTGLVWVGDQCRSPNCQGSPIGAACLLPQGGIGTCSESGCVAVNLQTDPSNCGFFDLVCPQPTVCLNGQCFDFASGPPGCNLGGECASSQTCFPGFGCVLPSCGGPGSQGQACLPLGNSQRPGTCCGEVCADIEYGNANCGGCGVACAGSCQDGVCHPYLTAPVTCDSADNGAICSDGGADLCCGGACVSFLSDAHCGSCERACPTGSNCVASFCIQAAEASDGGPADCASASDCPADHGCIYGLCLTTNCGPQSDNDSCWDDAGNAATCCGGACRDLYSDPQNCGLCGASCGKGQLCVGGGCVIPSPCENGSACALPGGGAGTCCGTTCVDPLADQDNCGGCGEVCPIGSSCIGNENYAFCTPDGGATGTCAQDADCPDGLGCLFGSCESSACDGGAPTCLYDAGGTRAQGRCCGSTCVGGYDSSNCGGCNVVCPEEASCDEYECDTIPSVGCGFCPPGTACLAGYRAPCLATTCGPDSDGFVCAFGPGQLGTCCTGICLDTLDDPANCAGCGMRCPSGVCYRGFCAETALSAPCAVSCPAGDTCAFDRCIGPACTSVPGICAAENGTLGVCCASGACAHPLDDPFDCGGCGIVCPSGQTCEGGTCSGSPRCGPALANGFCDLDGGLSWVCCAGAGCVDTSSNPANCGVCGSACPAGQSCASGRCQ